ncbi:MAG: efflux RND transporter permease subunit [Mycobacteriales bacterium]
MLRWIVGSGVAFARLVVAAAIALLVFGAFQLRSARVDTYPQFTPPSVQIQTEARGLSAAEVEQLITVPLEQDLLNGIPWLQHISSESVTGLSSIDLVFEPGTDVLRAREVTQERLSQAVALPNVGTPPVMIQPVSSTSRVSMIGLKSAELSLVDLSVLARWKIRPKLMGIPGVANVAVWGQRDRQLQVLVDPDKLASSGVSLSQVVDTTGNALWVSPLSFVEASTPGTGGFVDTPNQRFGVQHVFPITTAKQLSSVTIEGTSGRTMRLSDVADVVEDHQPLIGDAAVADDTGLVLVVQKFADANPREVARAVDEAMATLAPGLSGVDISTGLYQPASFLDAALHNVGLGVVIGLLLLAVVLGGVLLSWRAALVTLLTIPVAVVAAAYVLYLRGTTFTTMTLAGLVAAVGIVVDDAVVAVDALRVRRGPADGESPDADAPGAGTVVEAVLTGRGPLLAATSAVLLGLVPVLLLGGVAGAFARPLAISYLLAVLASTLVSLTLAPALAALLWSGPPSPRRVGPPVRWVQRGVQRALPWLTLRRRGWLLAGVLAVAGLAVLPQLGSAPLLPQLQDRALLVQLQATPGTSLTEMDRVTAAMGRELRTVEGVEGVGSHVGRAQNSDQVVNANSAELWLRVSPATDLASTTEEVERVVAGYPGLRHSTSSYPQERVRAAQAGPTHPLVVRVYGADFGTLRAQAEQVRQALSSVQGVRRAQVEAVPEEPTLQIEVDLAAAERYGVKPGDVRRAATTVLSGLPVGSLYEQQEIFDVVVWGQPEARRSLASVRDLYVDRPDGGRLRLSDVADVHIGRYPTVVRHDDVLRSLDVMADVEGRGVDAVRADAQDRVRAMSFPLEYRAEVLGTGDGGAAAAAGAGVRGRWLAAVLLVVAAAVVLLLQAATGSWRGTGLLVLTLPLALVGGVLTAPLAGGVRTLGALLGLLAVLGLALRAGLLLVREIGRLEQDGMRPGPGLVLHATRERVPPVLLTALATAALVLPFAMSGTVAGTELLHPLAVVVLGALVSSTLVVLLVLPVLQLGSARSRTAEAEPEPPPEPPPVPAAVRGPARGEVDETP